MPYKNNIVRHYKLNATNGTAIHLKLGSSERRESERRVDTDVSMDIEYGPRGEQVSDTNGLRVFDKCRNFTKKRGVKHQWK